MLKQAGTKMDICAQDKKHVKLRGCVEPLSFLLLEPAEALCKLCHGFNDYPLEEITYYSMGHYLVPFSGALLLNPWAMSGFTSVPCME